MAFVKKWHFERGKAIGKTDTQHYPGINKIPLWMIRRSLTHALQIPGAGGAHQRAFHQANLWEMLGQMRGYSQRNR